MSVPILLCVLGLGFLLYALFAFAAYALPFFAALAVGLWVHDSGAGLLTAILAAFFAGAGVLLAGQAAFAALRPGFARLVIGGLYAGPAALAGFHAVKGLSALVGAGGAWTLILASIGALMVGAAAWTRITVLAKPDEDAMAAHTAFSGHRAANDR